MMAIKDRYLSELIRVVETARQTHNMDNGKNADLVVEINNRMAAGIGSDEGTVLGIPFVEVDDMPEHRPLVKVLKVVHSNVDRCSHCGYEK